LNQKPINVIDCIKAVDGEVRVPRVYGKFSKCCISISFSFMGIFIVLMTLREGKR
jgi:hypothetical protein